MFLATIIKINTDAAAAEVYLALRDHILRLRGRRQYTALADQPQFYTATSHRLCGLRRHMITTLAGNHTFVQKTTTACTKAHCHDNTPQTLRAEKAARSPHLRGTAISREGSKCMNQKPLT